MAGSYNKVFLIGRLGKDPDLRYTQTGVPVANLSLATDESYTDREGNRQERTEWHKISVWNKQAESVSNYLSKGRLVMVEGSLQTNKWQDNYGQNRYSTEIRAQRVVFLDSKSDTAKPAPNQPSSNEQVDPNKKQDDDPFDFHKQDNENLGPAFPSEANTLDEAPF